MKRKALLLLLIVMTASVTACGSADNSSARGSIGDAEPIDNDKETEEKETPQSDAAGAAENEKPDIDAENADNKDDTTADIEETIHEPEEELPGEEVSEKITEEEPAPEYTGIALSVQDLDGNAVQTQDIFSSHKYTVVNMWATWCGPCVGEIPELAKMEEELAEKDCGLVGLLVDSDAGSIRDAKDILSGSDAAYLNIVMTRDLDRLFSSDYIPATFFVDQSGNIVGEPIVGADPDGYLKRIESLLGQ